MKSKRFIFVGALLFAAAVFIWASFYIPANQLYWTIHIGDGNFGLCHGKSGIFFALGDANVHVPSFVAATAVAFALGLPALILMVLAKSILSSIEKRETQNAG
jgi:hypothetical protein